MNSRISWRNLARMAASGALVIAVFSSFDWAKADDASTRSPLSDADNLVWGAVGGPEELQRLSTVAHEGLQPGMLLALPKIVEVYRLNGYGPVVVTSALDGDHKVKNTLHPSGRAVDLRIWSVPEGERLDLTAQLQRVLGPAYDVVFEGDHIHVEHDPEPARL